MQPNPQFPMDLVTFTEEILNEKLHFLRSEKVTRMFVMTRSLCMTKQLLEYKLKTFPFWV